MIVGDQKKNGLPDNSCFVHVRVEKTKKKIEKESRIKDIGAIKNLKCKKHLTVD